MRTTSRVTIKQVADVAGVSAGTVSNVLNNVTTVNKAITRQVLDTANRLGYHPNANARALSAKHTNTIGVLVYSITDPVMLEVVAGIEAQCTQMSLDLLLVHDQGREEDELRLTKMLLGRRVDGVIIVGSHSQLADERVINLYERNSSLLLVFREAADPRVPCLAIDDQEGARLATAHLIEHGHKDIALIGCPEITALEHRRVAGFLAAFAEYNLVPDRRLFERGDWDTPSGYHAMKRLLRRARPSAVFAFNDRMAIGAMSAIHEAGLKIPDDVAIVGFDDLTSLAQFSNPPLTTIAAPWRDIGAKAATSLADIISGKELRPRLTFATRLVVRQSCGCRSSIGIIPRRP